MIRDGWAVATAGSKVVFFLSWEGEVAVNVFSLVVLLIGSRWLQGVGNNNVRHLLHVWWMFNLWERLLRSWVDLHTRPMGNNAVRDWSWLLALRSLWGWLKIKFAFHESYGKLRNKKTGFSKKQIISLKISRRKVTSHIDSLLMTAIVCNSFPSEKSMLR